MLLSKGFEVEMYTGTPKGDVVGLSDKIVENLDGCFVREPDSRNVEYTTAPYCNYDRLLCALLKPRKKLRDYISTLGDYTILPGSTLSLGDSKRFFRSDPQNPYHDYIENTYGTDVVTASIHINVGISDVEQLIKACRLVRVEAPLYLALSASSPFIDGKATGYHSTRWQMFPKTPRHVPLFSSHQHFIDWTEEQLTLGTMKNVRHLWSSVRPNGDRRPYNLNRLELRISDLVVDPIALLAITALLEGRIKQLFQQPSIDPLHNSTFTPEELVTITDNNETAVAKHSLDAQLQHWQDGRTITAKEWIAEIYEQIYPTVKREGYSCFLSPVKKILRSGNMAQQWLQQYREGATIPAIVERAIQDMAREEKNLESNLCQQILVA